MNLLHYCNIGMAKSGTSALFAALQQHPSIDYVGSKENFNFSHYDWSTDDYKKHYSRFNISLNFAPSQWAMSSDQIAEISELITHCSVCLRNPWDYISSLYSFVRAYRVQTSEDFVDMMLETNQLDYAGIISRWNMYCKKPLLVLYYDDLVTQPVMVYHKIINFLGLSRFDIQELKRVNITKQVKQPIDYRQDQVTKINELIDLSARYLCTRLDHWKK